MCLIFFYSGIALLLTGQGLNHIAKDAGDFIRGFSEGLTISAVLLLVAAGLVLSFPLRFPDCGKRLPPPQWDVFPTEYFTKFKKPFVYDDENGDKPLKYLSANKRK